MKQLLILSMSLLVAISFSCVNKNKPEKIEMKAQESAAPSNENTMRFANFELTKPNSWTAMEPSSQMRLVEFANGISPENPIVGFYFGNREEMVQANIQRWRGQFSNEASFDRTVLDQQQVFVEITGTFMKKPFPMAQEFTNEEGYKMLAAIIPSDQGPYFFKVTGPFDEMEKLKPEFLLFIKSYKTM